MPADDTATPIEVVPVAVVRGGRTEATDDAWDSEVATIEFHEDRFPPDCLAGLSDFSHLDVVFVFHGVDESEVEYGSRRPRGRTDWPLVGIFAQRGRVRPNRIGVTTCRIESVAGLRVQVRGLDAIDGSPVLDVKPHMSGFAARGTVREPQWALEIMSEYW